MPNRLPVPAFALAVFAALAPFALVAGADRAAASDDALAGDVAAGGVMAQEVCAACHAVTAGDTLSPDPAATSFSVLANTPGITGRAINVWLTTFHPDRTMPAIVLTRDEREDIASYILSLSDN